MQDRRRARRIPSILEGGVTLESQPSPMSCTIRDLSTTGARIWLPESVDLPTEFVLAIPKLKQSLKVRLVWSKAQTHGVMFLEQLHDHGGDDATSLLEALQTSDHLIHLVTLSEQPPAASPKSRQESGAPWQRFLGCLLRKPR